MNPAVRQRWKQQSIIARQLCEEERMLAREDLLAAVPDYPQYPAKRMRRRSNLHEHNTTWASPPRRTSCLSTRLLILAPFQRAVRP
jgi:hypothetical protein